MKKIIRIIVVCFITTLITHSCIETPDTESFDETLLYGKWVSGTLYYTYAQDGNGTTWDTADDVTENEAQSFTWTLEASEFTHIYVLEIGGTVPKVYTLTELTDSTLVYEDDFAKSYSFSKTE